MTTGVISSVVDPDFKMRIWIQIQAILADPDPDQTQIHVISMDRARLEILTNLFFEVWKYVHWF